MPERPIGVLDESAAAEVADYRLRERSVSGVTVAEQYVILQRERVRSFLGMAATFRTATAPANLGSIWNAAGSTVLVAVLSVETWKNSGTNSTSMNAARLSRTGTQPTGGVALPKVSAGTGEDFAGTSAAAVTVLSAATADGTGTGLTIVEDQRIASLGQQFRLQSAVGEANPLNSGWPTDTGTQRSGLEWLDGEDPMPLAILRAGQGIVVPVEAPSTSASMGANFIWEEYLLP